MSPEKMVNIKKSAYILLLTENDNGEYSLVKLRRNFTYHFDSVIYGLPIDICHLYNILHLLTHDELEFLVFLYESQEHGCSTRGHTKSYLEAVAPIPLAELGNLAVKFSHFFIYCLRDLTIFSTKLEALKTSFREVIKISSHSGAIKLLMDKIHTLLDRGEKGLNVNRKPYVYPGGRKRCDDKSFLETAIRETEEETGIPKEYFRILKTKPLFKETYLGTDGVRYAQMFFVAKLYPKWGKPKLEKIFDEFNEVPLGELDDEDLLERTIKTLNHRILAGDSEKDEKLFITNILNAKHFTDSEVYRNYNTGKLVKDYKLAFIKYLVNDFQGPRESACCAHKVSV